MSKQAFIDAKYLPSDEIQTIASLAVKLHKPILIEGPPGTGKTSFADAIAQVNTAVLYRIQCYEGITAEQVIGEFNYQKQLIEIAKKQNSDVFTLDYFISRPLLQVMQREEPTVLLIDEVDRADEEFEAFLLEALGERQITIPELGTIRSKGDPIIILTSNGTRELSGALRRRSLYLALDYPSKQREKEIVKLHVPDLGEQVVGKLVDIVRRIRRNDQVTQAPSVSETIDFARALILLTLDSFDASTVQSLLGLLAKNPADLQAVEIMLKEGKLLDGKP